MSKYKYEVAFSFLKEDEPLAIQINDRIQDRLSTFVYSKNQEEVAGTDGEETFNKVFGEEARVVVVLHRRNWGNTPWTRIEETAIRNRGYEEGYDFVIFIPLEKPAQVPKWFPKTHIWANIERYGIDGAANIIETRVKQVGGSTREESVEEHASRVKRQIDAQRLKRQFLESDGGVKAAHEEFNRLGAQLEATVTRISAESDFDITIKHQINNKGFDWIEIYNLQFCVCLEWFLEYSNTLVNSRLDVTLMKGRPKRPSRFRLDEPQLLAHQSYKFDLDGFETRGWRRTDNSDFMPTGQFADFCLKVLIDKIHSQELSDNS